MNKTNKTNDFIKCLNILNINTNGYTESTFKYLFEDENTRKLLTFFCDYIANDNVISKQEYEAFEILEKNGLILPIDQLESTIIEVENNYDGIFEVDEEELKLLQEELEIEEEHVKKLENLIALNRENNDEIEHSIEALEVCNAELNEKLEDNYECLNQLCSQLNQTEDNITKMGFDIINSYKNQSTSYVDHLLYTFNRNSDILLSLLFNFMQSDFNKREIDSYPYDLLAAQLNEFKKRLSESLQNNILTEAELAYQKAIYDEITSCKSMKLPLSDQIDFEIFRYNQLVEQAKQDITSMNYLLASVPQIADNKISEFLIKYNQIKLEKRRKICEKVDNLLYYVSAIQKQSYFLNSFLFYDSETINKLQNLLIEIFDNLYHNQVGVNMRLNSMKNVIENFNVIKNNCVLNNSYFLQKFIQVSCNHKSDDLICLYKDISQIHNNYYQKLNIVFYENWNRFQAEKIKIEKKLTSTKRIIKNSQQTDILKLMFKTEKMITSENENAENVINEFKKIQKRITSDKWFKYQHFFWVWFLIQPKKILKVINEIHHAID